MLQPETQKYLIAAIFITAGVFHFIKPQPFAGIIPDFIPYHLALVYISGVAEILGGAGILWHQTEAIAAWGLIILLVAVFPANINMAVEAVQKLGYVSWYSAATILRLPLQFVLIYWVYRVCLK
ncbi:MAG TPA: hypothetical protein VFG39_07550 [Balneolaceae bacterium]|nr:hypothetical protein [Balneolaceae bacterium]